MISAAAISLIAVLPLHDLADVPVLSQTAIESGLQAAKCNIAPADARVIGTEWLGPGLRIIEVPCRRSGSNSSSILFAVPTDPSSRPQLIMSEDWQDGRVVPGYAVTSPNYDRKSRTLSSLSKARDSGDCGTIKEWKWTGWFFRLVSVSTKSTCDGEPFEWDDSYRWQVFSAEPSIGPFSR